MFLGNLTCFSLFFREFDLKLIPDESIFSNDFAAVLVQDDEEIEIPVDKDSFMTGYLEGKLVSLLCLLIGLTCQIVIRYRSCVYEYDDLPNCLIM